MLSISFLFSKVNLWSKCQTKFTHQLILILSLTLPKSLMRFISTYVLFVSHLHRSNIYDHLIRVYWKVVNQNLHYYFVIFIFVLSIIDSNVLYSIISIKLIQRYSLISLNVICFSSNLHTLSNE